MEGKPFEDFYEVKPSQARPIGWLEKTRYSSKDVRIGDRIRVYTSHQTGLEIKVFQGVVIDNDKPIDGKRGPKKAIVLEGDTYVSINTGSETNCEVRDANGQLVKRLVEEGGNYGFVTRSRIHYTSIVRIDKQRQQ